MTKLFVATLALLVSINSISQTKNTKGSIGVSIPFIWNKSQATYYRLGSPYYPSGNAVSYGLNINYSHLLYKRFYGIIGTGYYKQVFKIIRPFKFDSPDQFGYATNSYNYESAYLSGGLGYKLPVSKTTFLNGDVTYNQYYSFRQKYINNSPVRSQIDHRHIELGNMINFNIGIEKKVSKKVSLGADFIIPIYTHWNNDEIFYANGYSNKEQQIARNETSIGVVLSCNYNFN